MTATTEDRPRVRTPIDPRIRDRRIEVIREAGRRRLRVTLIVASAIVVVGLAYLAVHSPLLDVDHVRVTGTQRVSRDRRASTRRGVHTGDALLFVDTGAIARRVERLPWVEHATRAARLPGHDRDHRHRVHADRVRARRPEGGRARRVDRTGDRAHAHARRRGAVEVLGVRDAPGGRRAARTARRRRRDAPASRRGSRAQVRAIDVGGRADARARRAAGTRRVQQRRRGAGAQIRSARSSDLARRDSPRSPCSTTSRGSRSRTSTCPRRRRPSPADARRAPAPIVASAHALRYSLDAKHRLT